MLLQSDINKWRLSQLTKLDKLYINSASTRLLQRFNINLIEYKHQTSPKNSYIHLRACDDASSYNSHSPFTGPKIPKLDCISKCCSDCPRMNDPYLESSEQLDMLIPSSLQKVKFHIFQNTSKCSIHGLIPFKYNNPCELCENIQ